MTEVAETKRIKWTFEMCARYVSEETDCTLLSKEYVPASKGKMEFSCERCGKAFSCSWNNFYRRDFGRRLCDSCGGAGRRKRTQAEFISEVDAIYGYGVTVLGEYKDANTRVECRCNLCHQTWTPFAAHLLRGRGCPLCAHKYRSKQGKFVRNLYYVHGDSYSIVGNFCNLSTKVEVSCKRCGKHWLVRPHNLLQGKGCPNCKKSRGETRLKKILERLQLPHEVQFTFPDCRNKRELPFDLAVLDIAGQSPTLLIEYDGQQHFKPVDFFGGQQEFEYRQHNDRIKDSYCKDHGIPLLRISYKQFDQIEQLVTDKLYELNILQKEAA